MKPVEHLRVRILNTSNNNEIFKRLFPCFVSSIVTPLDVFLLSVFLCQDLLSAFVFV